MYSELPSIMLGTSGLLLLSSIGLFNWLVNIFAFHPEPGNFFDPSEFDESIQEVFFQTEDGLNLQAFFVPSPNRNRVILYLHGNAGNASMRLPEVHRLANLGVNVLLLSYRGYGKSEGIPSEEGVYLDGQAALQYLQSHLGFSLDHTVILGRSLGSAVAIDLAQHNQVAGVILVTPFSSGRDLAGVMGLSWLAWVTGEPFPSVEKIQHIRSPALFIHGSEDHIVPPALARKLFDRCPFPKNWKLIQGADHNNLVQVGGQEYWDVIHQFLDATISR